MVLTIFIKFSLEDGSFAEILETPNHGSTGDDILDFLLKLTMDGSVDGSIKLCAILWNFRSGFNHELVNDVFLLFEIDLVKIGEEVAVLSFLELRFVLTISSWQNLNALL